MIAPNGSRIDRPNCRRCRTPTLSSSCRIAFQTRPPSMRSCSALPLRRSPPSPPIPGIWARKSASPRCSIRSTIRTFIAWCQAVAPRSTACAGSLAAPASFENCRRRKSTGGSNPSLARRRRRHGSVGEPCLRLVLRPRLLGNRLATRGTPTSLPWPLINSREPGVSICLTLEMTSMAFCVRRSCRGLKAGRWYFAQLPAPHGSLPKLPPASGSGPGSCQDRLDVDLHGRLGDIDLSGYAFVGIAFDQAAQN